MKKKILLISMLSTCSVFTFAQSGNVGVNTNNPGSNLTVNGSFAAQYRSVTATSYNMAADDYYLLWSGASAGTITLPVGTAAANMKGRVYIIRNNTPGTTLTINTQSGESTSLGATLTVPFNGGVDLMNTGAASGTTWDVMQFRSSQTAGSLVHSANKLGAPVTGGFDTVNVGVTKYVNGCADTIVSQNRPVSISVTAVGYATNSTNSGTSQGAFILEVDGVDVTTCYFSSYTGSLSKMPVPAMMTYTGVLPAGSHIIRMKIKNWSYAGPTPAAQTWIQYNLDAVTIGYGGASSTADRDAIKPGMMIQAFSL